VSILQDASQQTPSDFGSLVWGVRRINPSTGAYHLDLPNFLACAIA
jgi:hypothetical protein